MISDGVDRLKFSFFLVVDGPVCFSQLLFIAFQNGKITGDDLFKEVIDESFQGWHAPFSGKRDPVYDV